jgi:predicted CXXCH cytochrome family protein
VTVLPLKYGRGHPTEGHPVTNVMDPSDVSKVLKPVNCLSCHQPHSSAQASLLIKVQSNNMAFCMTCHTGFTK